MTRAERASRSGAPPPDLSAEWRLLRRAALFFVCSAAIYAALVVIGLFH